MAAEPGAPARDGRRPALDGRPGGRSPALSIAGGAACALAGGLLAALALVAGVRWLAPGTLEGPVGGDGGWTSRTPAWVVADGFYPGEVDASSGRGFSWSGRRARLAFPNLDRSQAYRLTLRVSAWRPPAGPELPQIQLSVDGGVLPPVQATAGKQEVVAAIPRRADDGAIVVVDVSNAFVPGPHDRRELGIVVENAALAPASGHLAPSWKVLGALGVAVAATIAGLIFSGMRAPIAPVASAVVALGFVGLLLCDGAFVGGYVTRLVPLGIGIAVAGLAAGAARSWWRRTPGRIDWSAAAGVALCALSLELAVFAHPQAIVGDGIFQVHRAMVVHGGSYFFTSITPKPFFEFPYPVGLYLAAQPFWSLFPSELDLLRLLRGLTLVAGSFAGLALYAAVRRQWNDAYTALVCVALWMLSKAPLQGLSNANLTNVFGQALFAAGMGLLIWAAAGPRVSVPALLAASGVLAASFLSHFGTVLTGVPILAAVAAAMLAFGRGGVRRFGVWVLAVILASSALSYGVYYARFNAVYAATLTRMASHQAEASSASKVVAPPADKFRRWLDGTSDDYGVPGLPLAAAAGVGLAILAMRRPREAATLTLAGWTLAWAAFTVLEIFSPLELRANLAAAPVFVCLAAYALGTLRAHSRAGALVAALAALLVGWEGVRILLLCLGVRS